MLKRSIIFLTLSMLLVSMDVAQERPTNQAVREPLPSTSAAERTIQAPYLHVRELLARRALDEADTEVLRLLALDPTSATLQLYQTEIWIARADDMYTGRRYRSAFALYEKAYRRWPSHPVVRARYLELKGAPQTDELPQARDVTASVAPAASRSIARPVPAGSAATAPVNIYIVDPTVSGEARDLLLALNAARQSVEQSAPKTVPGNVDELTVEVRSLAGQVRLGIFVLAALGVLLLIRIATIAAEGRRRGSRTQRSVHTQ